MGTDKERDLLQRLADSLPMHEHQEVNSDDLTTKVVRSLRTGDHILHEGEKYQVLSVEHHISKAGILLSPDILGSDYYMLVFDKQDGKLIFRKVDL